MPRYGGSRRKKRRTHKDVDPEEFKQAPRSFIFRQGQVSVAIHQLVHDLRMLMEPFTASSLKESKKNRLKDFVQVAGPLGVSHFVTIHHNDLGPTMRFLRVPRGPTLTFRISQFSLMKDIVAMQRRPHSPGIEYKQPPLVVLNGFGTDESDGDGAIVRKIAAAMFQNMFPAINVNQLQLKDCRRIALFNFREGESEENGEKQFEVDVRHYLIRASPVGLTKTVKRIIKGKISKLGKYDDFGEYVENGAGDITSDSEAEDAGLENRVTLPQNFVGRGNLQNQQSAVRLQELGPRLRLRLLKIEDGMTDGEVLYHYLGKKSKEELEEIEKRRAEAKRLKEERRRLQKQNVELKKKKRSRTEEDGNSSAESDEESANSSSSGDYDSEMDV